MPVAEPKYFQHKRRGKPFYQSKTLWANALLFAASFHPLAAQHHREFLNIFAGTNLLLRALTTERLGVK